MTKLTLLNQKRLRKIPSRFSWIDQRLVRKGHLQKCSSHSQGLYLFLLTVGDSQGMSYYKDRSIEGFLNMTTEQLVVSRFQLIQLELISYRTPYYQVLSLDFFEKKSEKNPGIQDLQSIGNVLSSVLNGERHHD